MIDLAAYFFSHIEYLLEHGITVEKPRFSLGFKAHCRLSSASGRTKDYAIHKLLHRMSAYPLVYKDEIRYLKSYLEKQTGR